MAKLELSAFNGREPDESRYDLDLRPPDSFSVRLSANPTPRLSTQVSCGYLPRGGMVDVRLVPAMRP